MRNLDAGLPILRERLIKTGISTTTTGVLLMKAETPPTPTARTAMNNGYGSPFSRSRPPANISIAPHFSSAKLIMNMAAMARGAGFEKTSRSCFTVGRWLEPVVTLTTSKMEKALMAVTSTGTFSKMKLTTVATTNALTNMISQLTINT